jgi:hypothetical protein
MKYTRILLAFLAAVPVAAFGQTSSDEEVVSLNPFEVTAEPDAGYAATSTLAGTRIRGELKDISGGVSVVTAQFLRDTTAGIPQVPVTVVKKADALVIQFALATTVDKADARNAELNAYIEAISKAVAASPGLRFEPREVFLAGADRKRSIIGKGGTVTSFAHFVVFAELGEGVRPYQRVKQVRDLVSGLKIDAATTRLIDGPAGLYLRRPGQYRNEILAKVFDDIDVVKKGLGQDFEILASGLSGGIRMRTCSETEVELWIDYSFTIRSVRELLAAKK